MTAKWFRRFGQCNTLGCSKPGAGELMDERNGVLGTFCERCAKIRIQRESRAQ